MRKPRHALNLLEIALLLALGWWLCADLLVWDPSRKLPGYEHDWVTGAGYAAAQQLRDFGYLPLWQPHYFYGLPLVDDAHSFLLNPFMSLPALLIGGEQGLKLAVVVQVMVAGLGGWFLGAMLKLNAAGRLLLGALLMTRGSMGAVFNTGYFQLAAQQAYFPWVTAGALGVLRDRSRWPVVLLALSMALIFFAGNLWYTLPMMLQVGVMALLVGGQRVEAWRRLTLAAALSIGLTAVTLFSIGVHFDHIGAHGVDSGWRVGNALEALLFFFVGDPAFVVNAAFIEGGGWLQIYYHFTLPLWFALLIVVLLPPVKALRAQRDAMTRRVILAGAVLFALMTLWGLGDPILWGTLYEALPVLGEWRFVGRALSVSGFWLVVAAAWRVDGLSRVLLSASGGMWAGVGRAGALLALVASPLAVLEVASSWGARYETAPLHAPSERCLGWLRDQHPRADLIPVWRWGYDIPHLFIDHNLRLVNIEADFLPLPEPATLLDVDLTRRLPAYAIATSPETHRFLRDAGYQPVSGAPMPDNLPCLYHAPQRELAYAFVLSAAELARVNAPQDLNGRARPVPYRRWPDTIVAASDQRGVLVIQETAYPGWRAWVNDQPAPVESVGGWVGVRLPDEPGSHRVKLAYRPPLVFYGALLTLLTAASCLVFLLRTPARQAIRPRRGREIRQDNEQTPHL